MCDVLLVRSQLNWRFLGCRWFSRHDPAGELGESVYAFIDSPFHYQHCVRESFEIGKYPVTNAQFAEFIGAADGYANEDWWDYSIYALRWRRAHPQAIRPKLVGPDHPCVNVCWYEALAFSRWLSDRAGMNLSLPTEQQWQRAAQGDDGRLFPWGNEFDKNRANTRESRVRMTTLVMRYQNGVSPYGVYDMAGNVWEWCLNAENADESPADLTINANRAVHGGSFIGVNQRAQAPFRFYLSPVYFYATIGFRLVYTA